MLLITLCVGFLTTAVGAYFFLQVYPASTSSPISKYAENPSGFLFLTSEDIIPSTAKFHVMIDSLDQQNDSAHVNVEIDFLRSMANSNGANSSFFVLQVLNHISNVNVGVNGDRPENLGKKNSIIWNESYSTSYLVVEFPRANLAGHIDVIIDFTWQGLFWQRSFYAREIIVPFSNNFPTYIHDVGLPEQAIHEEGILRPDETLQTLLSVAKPDQSTISGTEPSPDSITFSTRRVWYFWDVKKDSNSTLYESTAFVIDMEVNDKKNQYDQIFAAFALMVGIGIPMIISSITELLKTRSRVRSNGQSSASQVVSKTHGLLIFILSLALVISLGFIVFLTYHAAFNIIGTLSLDRIATFLLSIGGICVGSIYFWLRSWFVKDRTESSELTRSILISLSMKDHKNALDTVLKDYEMTNKEIDRRENITLIVGTILITGSLIILGNTATANPVIRFPYAFSSILLYVLWLLASHLTTTKLDYMAFTRARAIEIALKEHYGYDFGVHKYVWDKMSNKDGKAFLWVEFRRNFWGIILIALSVSWLIISVFKS
jgi:hypothetical protein